MTKFMIFAFSFIMIWLLAGEVPVTSMSQQTPHEIYLPIARKNYNSTPADKVDIPAGHFQMGCDPEHNTGSTYCFADELPLHQVYLDSYSIDRKEITNAQYSDCVGAAVCTPPTSSSSSTRPSYYADPAFADYPVIFVSWDQANEYCTWMGGRLPTEAEWEKAARGDGTVRSYPWGDQPATCSLANFSAGDNCIYDTTPTGYFPSGISPYGIYDLAGNVYEWVNDWYDEDYYFDSPGSNPPGPASGSLKGLRGGGWQEGWAGIRTANRYALYPNTTADSIGFRCAYSHQ